MNLHQDVKDRQLGFQDAVSPMTQGIMNLDQDAVSPMTQGIMNLDQDVKDRQLG